MSLRIYDILGIEIAKLQDGNQSPGYYQRAWVAENVTTGIYFYLLKAGNFTECRKMILLK